MPCTPGKECLRGWEPGPGAGDGRPGRVRGLSSFFWKGLCGHGQLVSCPEAECELEREERPVQASRGKLGVRPPFTNRTADSSLSSEGRARAVGEGRCGALDLAWDLPCCVIKVSHCPSLDLGFSIFEMMVCKIPSSFKKKKKCP